MKPAMKVEDLCVDLVTRRQKKRIVDHVNLRFIQENVWESWGNREVEKACH